MARGREILIDQEEKVWRQGFYVRVCKCIAHLFESLALFVDVLYAVLVVHASKLLELVSTDIMHHAANSTRTRETRTGKKEGRDVGD